MKSLIATICILGMIGMVLGMTAKAAEEATVAATVMVRLLSVSVSDGVVTYGTMEQNATKSTIPAGLGDQQTVTNSGNDTENFNIKGLNSTNWTLGATAGSDVYVHRFCNGGGATGEPCVNPPTGYTALTTDYATFATGIAVNGTATLNLQINTPNPSTIYTQQSVNVTLVAIAG